MSACEFPGCAERSISYVMEPGPRATEVRRWFCRGHIERAQEDAQARKDATNARARAARANGYAQDGLFADDSSALTKGDARDRTWKDSRGD